MCAVLCDHWKVWLTSNMDGVHMPFLQNPSTNSRQLRLTVMSWIGVDTSNLVQTLKTNDSGESNYKMDTPLITNSDMNPLPVYMLTVMMILCVNKATNNLSATLTTQMMSS